MEIEQRGGGKLEKNVENKDENEEEKQCRVHGKKGGRRRRRRKEE